MDLDIAVTERSCGLKANEARPHDKHAPGSLCAFDYVTTVRQRTQCFHMWRLSAGHLQTDRFSTRGDQKPVEWNGLAGFNRHSTICDIDRGCSGAEAQIDSAPVIEIIVAQRNPFFRRRTGQVVLGKVGSVVRR